MELTWEQMDFRLIPAHAGKTSTRRRATASGGAHPRSRGENASEAERNESAQGSSPLTRGKRAGHLLSLNQLGLIPAHAGKTFAAHAFNTVGRAHPRSRGENDTRGSLVLLSWGSSPLTRGKLRRRCRGVAVGGLIPAHAGKTSE